MFLYLLFELTKGNRFSSAWLKLSASVSIVFVSLFCCANYLNLNQLSHFVLERMV